jgi:predicted Zn-dependent peptidase
LAAKGVTEAELRRAQSQIKGALLMGLENSSNVMSRLGKGETNYRKILSVDELVELIMAVNTEDVQNMAKQLFQKDKLVFTQVGAKEYDVDINSLL